MKILLLAFLLPGYCFGQKCKSKYDEFQKTTTVSTGFDKIGNYKPGGLSNRFFLQGTISASDTAHFFLGLMPEFSSMKIFDENEEITFLFTSGETLKIYSARSSVSHAKSGKAFSQGTGSIIYYNDIICSVEMDALVQLKANEIKKIRIGAYDFDITDGDYFQKAVGCIEKSLNGK